MALRTVFGAGVIAIALAGCIADDLTKPDQSSVSATPAGHSVSREEAAHKGAGAVGGKSGYVLCNLVDHYKERTTNYYVCRSGACAGQELLAESSKATRTRTGCINRCRSMERQTRSAGLNKSYCVN